MKIKRPAPVPSAGGMPKRGTQKLKLRASIARSRSSRVKDDDDDYYDAPEPNMKLSHAFVVVLVLHVIAVGGVFAFNTIKSNQRSNPVAALVAPETVEAATAATVTSEKAADLPTPGIIAPPSRPLSAEPVVAAKSPQTGTHEVQSGETLHRIASQYGVSVAALQEVNEIIDPTKIRIGTLLILPSNAKMPASTAAVPSAPVAVAKVDAPKPVVSTPVKKDTPAASTVDTASIVASGEIYEVVKGDNPVNIAKKLNVSYSDLLTLNGIEDPRKLQIGQKLKIPSAN